MNLNKTLTQLEKDDWGELSHNSYLIQECHKLRYKPLNKFTVEDLRIMIGQKISLDYLIPLALDILYQNPFVSGDYYNGDLLVVVLKLDKEFWNKNKAFRAKIDGIIFEVENIHKTLEKEIIPLIKIGS